MKVAEEGLRIRLLFFGKQYTILALLHGSADRKTELVLETPQRAAVCNQVFETRHNVKIIAVFQRIEIVTTFSCLRFGIVGSLIACCAQQGLRFLCTTPAHLATALSSLVFFCAKLRSRSLRLCFSSVSSGCGVRRGRSVYAS